MNVQGAMIDENELIEFDIQIESKNNPKTLASLREASTASDEAIQKTIHLTLEKLTSAKRPLIIAGHGIRLSKQEETFKKLVEKIKK